MRFQREHYSAGLISEMLPLWRKHHDEIAGRCYGPLDPDLGTYERLDAMGLLRIYTARFEEGLVDNELAGYQVFGVSMHPHSRETKQAVQDVLYLLPAARKGLVGYNFLKWCVDELKQEGVMVVFQHISAGRDIRSLMGRLDFKIVDHVYGRELCQLRSH